MDNKLIYLFGSTSRPVYRENNINALCFPQGFIMHYRYDEKWVSKEIISNIDNLRNYETLIVFVDTTDGDIPHFYPIRKAKIKKIEIDGDFYHFYIELFGEWVDYRESGKLDKLKEYDPLIKDIEENPTSENPKFVSIDTLNDEIKLSEDSPAWTSIIEKIGNKEPFKNVLFYRIDDIYEIDSRESLKITNFGETKAGYTVKSGKKYNMELSFNYGKEPPEEALTDRLIASIDENLCSAIPNELRLGFRADRQDIYLNIKESLQDSMTYLIIKFKEGKVEGPNVTIPIKVTYNRLTIYGLVILFLIGTLLTSGLVSSLINVDQFTQNILKIVGSIFSTLVVFSLYKQLK